MAEGYDTADVVTITHEEDPNPNSATRFAFLTDVLNCEEVRINSCTIAPGEKGPYHKHETQEELYVALDGPGQLVIDGDAVEIPENGVVRVPAETPRRFDNRSNDEQHWLMIGAPPVGSNDNMGEAVLVEE